jgi:hypothetical protein
MAPVGVLAGRSEHDGEIRPLRDVPFGRIIDSITDVIANARDEGELAPRPRHAN